MFSIPSNGKHIRPKILQGNWFEEHAVEELDLKKKITINSSWKTMQDLLQLINRPYKSLMISEKWNPMNDQLSTREFLENKSLKFGDYVQIRNEQGLTLAFDLWTKTHVPHVYDNLGKVQDSKGKDYVLLASTFHNPVSRNVFRIDKFKDEKYQDELIRHGVKFRLTIPEDRFGKQYAIKSVTGSISRPRTQRNDDVVVCDYNLDGYETAWQIRDVSCKNKTWETPILKVNEPILLNHCLSNAFLKSNSLGKAKFTFDEASQVYSSIEMDKLNRSSYHWKIVALNVE